MAVSGGDARVRRWKDVGEVWTFRDKLIAPTANSKQTTSNNKPASIQLPVSSTQYPVSSTQYPPVNGLPVPGYELPSQP